MVMNFTKCTDADGRKAYFTRSGEEIPGHEPSLIGKGWMRLGFPDGYTTQLLKRMLDGYHPIRPNLYLTQRMRKGRIAAWDATFNFPKSATLAAHYAPGGDIVRRIGLQAMVDTFREDIEPRAKVRVNEAGRTTQIATTGELAAILFPHGLARPEKGIPMPHDHGHLLIFNVTGGSVTWADGKAKAVNTIDIEKHLPQIEAGWHQRFRAGLEQAGFRTRDKGKFWEIAGVPEAAIQKFSERRGAVLKLYEGMDKVTSGLRRKAGLMTRKPKLDNAGFEELKPHWDAMLTDREKDAFRYLQVRPKVNRPPRDRTGVQKHLDFARRVATIAREVAQERGVAHEH